MKKEIKNANFHKQLKGEKVQEMTMILLLSFNNKVIYDIVANKTNEELQKRIKEININNVTGFSYIAVTNKNSFIEYKREIITSK